MSATTQQIVTFRLGDEFFAADIYAVERVLRFQPPRTVPDMPDWIEGIIEYQGRVVPVVGLRRRFGMPALPPRTETRILVFATEHGWIGAVVDAVLEVATVAADQLAPPPSLFRGLSAAYVRAIIRREGRLTIFLDVARLLTASEQLSLEAVGEAALSGAGTPVHA
jgi:purine-binding chemotaxis protein CheW